jgi:hypothetical protein
MPWYGNHDVGEAYITTDGTNRGWWGTLITDSCTWAPAPYMSNTNAAQPGAIWYWVKCNTVFPTPTPTLTPTPTITETPTPTPTLTITPTVTTTPTMTSLTSCETGPSFSVTNVGSSAYSINDGTGAQDNPCLKLFRGQTYTFTLSNPAHPFWIKTQPGNGVINAYNDGITPNNGMNVGVMTFTVPCDAPDILYYNCQFHSLMGGTIFILGDCGTPTPTPTISYTPTMTPTPTLTETPFETQTPTPTSTLTPTMTSLTSCETGPVFSVINVGASAYSIDDGTGAQNNPCLELFRGQTYTFNINNANHPFWIKTQRGKGVNNAYNDGVSPSNGINVGVMTFTVPCDAPDILYYQCQFHNIMGGTIFILGQCPTPTPTPTLTPS